MVLPYVWFQDRRECSARARHLPASRQTAANLAVKIRLNRPRRPSKIVLTVRILICSGHRS